MGTSTGQGNMRGRFMSRTMYGQAVFTFQCLANPITTQLHHKEAFTVQPRGD